MVPLPQLVIAAQHGDIEAFGQLVQRFERMALAVAYTVLGDMHLAEDAAQEACIEAFIHLRQLREPAAFAPWFRRIVLKRADRLVRGKQLFTVPLEAADQICSTTPEPATLVEVFELQEQVQHALTTLRQEDRQLVQLFHLHGYAQQEIAQLVGLPEAVVKKRLFRARRYLRQSMEETMSEFIAEHVGEQTAFARSVQFFAAVRTGAHQTVQQLLQAHPELAREHERWDEEFARRNRIPAIGSFTALHRAVADGNQPLASLLLAHGADPNAGTKIGETPLHIAAIHDQAALLGLLLAHGADPNQPTERGLTPLHWAVIRARREAMQALLQAGANADLRDAEGRSVSDWAAIKGVAIGAAPVLWETGIKAVDFYAPIPRGGTLVVQAEPGVGLLVLMSELTQRVAAEGGCAVKVDLDDEAFPVAEKLNILRAGGVEQHATLLSAALEAPVAEKLALVRSALATATAASEEGRHVLLMLDDGLLLPETFHEFHGRRQIHGNGSLTLVLAFWRHTTPEPTLAPAVQAWLDKTVDATIVLSREIARQGIWPAIDGLRCTSRLLPEGQLSAAHQNAVAALQRTLREEPASERAQQARLLGAQPFVVAEPYTARPGVFVPYGETVQAYAKVVAGA
jgi:RNA polymerase sigma factor (sigma-70 family)